jgi:hypothetical protein
MENYTNNGWSNGNSAHYEPEHRNRGQILVLRPGDRCPTCQQCVVDNRRKNSYQRTRYNPYERRHRSNNGHSGYNGYKDIRFRKADSSRERTVLHTHDGKRKDVPHKSSTPSSKSFTDDESIE